VHCIINETNAVRLTNCTSQRRNLKGEKQTSNNKSIQNDSTSTTTKKKKKKKKKTVGITYGEYLRRRLLSEALALCDDDRVAEQHTALCIRVVCLYVVRFGLSVFLRHLHETKQ
jgi:hypothetical protein